MKLFTAFALFSIGMTGAACSQAETPEQAAVPEAEIQTVSAEEPMGTFNLNIGGMDDDTASGGLNLNLGDTSDDDLLVGSEGFGGGDFGEDPVIGDLDLDGDAPTEPKTEEDDIIRLD